MTAQTWQRYQAAHTAYLETRSPAAADSLVNAYSAWCREFCPMEAPTLVAQLKTLVMGRAA